MSKFAPSGWTLKELGDVTDKIEGGGTPSRTEPAYWNGDIPWVTVKDLKKVRLSFAEESISALGLKESASRLIPKNTLIIATRMALGKAVMFDRAVTINQDLKAVFPKSALDPEYLLHWYLSKAESIQSMGTGSTVKGIRLEDLRLIPIALPPLPEQQKIASILTAIDEVIESTQAQINKLKDLKTGMMQELLTKGIGHTEFKDSPVGRIPKTWEVATVEDVSKEVVVGIVVQPTQYYVGSGVPALRSANVREVGLNADNLKYITQEANEKLKKSQVRIGDLVTVRTGYPGTTAVVNKRFDGANCIDIIITRPTDLIDPDFLCTWVNSDSGKGQVLKAQGGLAQQHFNVGDMKKMFVAMPSLEEQKKISIILRSSTLKLEAANLKLNRLFDVKKGLMQDLLTGKVRVCID